MIKTLLVIFGFCISTAVMAATQPTKPVDKNPPPVYTVSVQCPSGQTIGLASHNQEMIIRFVAMYTGVMSAKDWLEWMDSHSVPDGPPPLEVLKRCFG